MEFIIAAIAGYLFGCINPATIIAKIKKVDIRNIGSKNPGASNVFITVGIGYGVLVGILDILKSFFGSTDRFYVDRREFRCFGFCRSNGSFRPQLSFLAQI